MTYAIVHEIHKWWVIDGLNLFTGPIVSQRTAGMDSSSWQGRTGCRRGSCCSCGRCGLHGCEPGRRGGAVQAPYWTQWLCGETDGWHGFFFFDADVREGKEKRRGWVLGISLKPKKLLAVHQTPRPCSGVPRSLLPVRKTNVESYANVTYTRRLHAMFPLLTFTATSQRPRAFRLVWIGTENFSWLDIATSNHARSSGRTVISADVQRSSFNRIRRLSNAQSFAKLLDRYYLLLMLSTTLSRIFSGDSMPRTVQMINLSEMAGLLVRIKIILIRDH